MPFVEEMELENFRPQSKLVAKTTPVEKPRFPAFDAHNHLGEDFGGGWDQKPLPELLDLLDQAGIVRYVDLDGGWGEHLLNAHLDDFQAREILHATFGSIMMQFGAQLKDALIKHQNAYLLGLKAYFEKHLSLLKADIYC